jgi:hypothetical protein
METWLNSNPNAPVANLRAVVKRSSTQSGQDYVIPGVPEGAATLGLLGIGVLLLVVVSRRVKI